MKTAHAWIPRILRILVGTSLLLLPIQAAQAQTPTPTPSPMWGGCFGATDICVSPELSFSAAKYNLVTKKWAAGALPVGAGYVLLVGQTKWWASGLAAHAIFNFTSGSPNFVEPSLTLVGFRYFHAGMTWYIADGYQQASVIVGASLPVEPLTTDNVQTKAKALTPR